jgi:hypothetical protein
MTGQTAKIEPVVGAKYSACNGYVTGKLVILDLGRRIVMSWRTTDFPRDAADSRVEVHFETLGLSTRLLILHTDIPEGQSEKYKALWNDVYVSPMRAYFSKFLPDPRNPPVRRIPPPPPESDEDEDEEDEVPVKGKGKLGAKPSVAAGIPVKSTQLGKGPAPARGAPSAKGGPPPKAANGPSVHKTESKPAPAKPAAAKPTAAAKPAKKPAAPAKKPTPAKKPVPAKKLAAKPAKGKPAAKKPAAKPAKGKPAAKKPAAKPAKGKKKR